MLDADRIALSYGSSPVLQGVSLRLQGGRVQALIGPNGSGKSSLIRVLTGVVRPGSGTVRLDGEPTTFSSPAAAASVGVGVVHQHYHLFGQLSVAANVRGVIGGYPRSRTGLLDRRRADREVGDALADLGIDVDPSALVRDLGPAERKLVEIARALAAEPRVLILDEPTASLEPRSAAAVLALVRRLAERGLAVCFVSHRLDEVVELSDAVTVLRDGRVAADIARPPASERELIDLMLDGAEDAYQARTHGGGDTLLALDGVRLASGAAPVALEVAAGEVVVTHGLLGSGASRLVRMVGGAEPLEGTLRMGGAAPRAVRSPRDAQKAGIGFLPEDRKAAAVVPHLSVAENIALPRLGAYARGPWLDRRRMRADAEAYRERLRIVSSSVAAPLGTLSGGNQQKALIARWLDAGVRLLAVEEPTHGVDIRGRRQIHDLLHRFADDGGAVLVACSEPEEALQLGHRVLVLRHGELIADLQHGAVTQNALSELCMTGRTSTTTTSP